MTVNYKNSILFILLLLISVSCQDLDKIEKPDDLIPEAKMIDVLTELSLVYAARNYNKQKLENIGVKPDEYVYKKFNIDSLQFERSNNYYSEQHSQYERIYDSVKARIQKMKNRLDSLREIEVKIEDSLKQVERDSLKALDSLKIDSLGGGVNKIDSLKLKQLRRMDVEEEEDSLLVPPVSTDENS